MGENKTGVEKRKHTRNHLAFYLRVFDGKSNLVVGHLMDISSGGLMLLSDEHVPVKKEYLLRMRLPTEVVGRDEIVFGAISRWCRVDENPDFYISGFQIQSLDDDTKQAVQQLIGEFSFQG